jgi:hypothetical protein
MKNLSILFVLASLGLVSCERHTWETKKENGGPKASDSINFFKHDAPSHGQPAAGHTEKGH